MTGAGERASERAVKEAAAFPTGQRVCRGPEPADLNRCTWAADPNSIQQNEATKIGNVIYRSEMV